MGNIFAGSEIVELGIQIEKNGRDFYNTLVKKTKNESSREVFKYLAGEEEKHIVVFQKILEKLEKYEPANVYADEYFAYMNSLASEYVFTQKDKGEEIAKKIKGDKEAIDMGIKFEKDSILFYDGMKKAVSADEQKVVDELISQEKDHLLRLFDLKNNI